MPVWGIVLLVIFVILLAVFIGLMIFGNKLRKQQDEQQAQIDAAKQVMSMLIIDKKKMKLKDANLPKMVLEQTPKYLRGSKMPIVKAKIGPRIMTLMADPKVFDLLPVKAEVNAEVSRISCLTSFRLRPKSKLKSAVFTLQESNLYAAVKSLQNRLRRKKDLKNFSVRTNN